MKKNLFIICCLCLVAFWSVGQQCATFEDIALQPDSCYNGSDGKGGFYSGGFWFPNSYNAEWNSWIGFSVSNMKDTITAGYGNQYSAITAGGVDSSENYAVAYHYGELDMDLRDTVVLSGFYVTNSTYAYLAMRDGDDFSKKFGGITGDDPDYFKLIITGINAEGAQTGIKEFFLADFTFEDQEKDYIVDSWEWVDLKILGEVAHLKFSLESTDVSPCCGMNTPSYFCIDNFNDSLPVFSKTIIDSPGELKIYPNPVKDIFYAGVPNDAKEIIIVSSDGRVIVRKEIYDQRVVRISDLSGLPSGTYLLHVKTRDTILTGKLMKL